MSFQALNELIRVNDCRGKLAQDFVIGLDLRIQVTCRAGQINQRFIQAGGEHNEICIDVSQCVPCRLKTRMGRNERRAELLIQIGREQPFAKGAWAIG